PASVFEELDEGAQAKPAGDARPAHYSGRVSGGRATLTVAFADTDETAGSYALAFGAEPQLVKCL
ncbi:MAG: hypothetical protein H7Z38_08050, partial [Rubrivivax sp.]|nr:hypothetical protein [Pyrinomonadaceae bacterium]